MNARSILPRRQSNITRESILRAVCEVWHIDEQEIFGPSKKQPESFARQLCMALMYQMTNMTLMDVGAYFSNRHHSTILHAIKRVDLASSDPDIVELINQSIRKIQSNETR